MQTAEELVDLLTLEPIENNIFRGQNYQAPWKRVFGGQVLAQSLHAAAQTVPADRIVHSLHAYFILAGDISKPIIYNVERLRDGGSFTTRRVTAIQNGRPIFNMAASFQLRQEGFVHQQKMPDVKMPEELITDLEEAESYKEIMPQLYNTLSTPRPIEFRPCESLMELVQKREGMPQRNVWIKVKGKLSDEQSIHNQVLAYASDYNLLTTSLFPHFAKINFKKLQLASLDHGMWFHDDFRIDDWLLYSLESPSASRTRGYTRGNIYTREGKLVASIVQEGLIRIND